MTGRVPPHGGWVDAGGRSVGCEYGPMSALCIRRWFPTDCDTPRPASDRSRAETSWASLSTVDASCWWSPRRGSQSRWTADRLSWAGSWTLPSPLLRGRCRPPAGWLGRTRPTRWVTPLRSTALSAGRAGARLSGYWRDQSPRRSATATPPDPSGLTWTKSPNSDGKLTCARTLAGQRWAR